MYLPGDPTPYYQAWDFIAYDTDSAVTQIVVTSSRSGALPPIGNTEGPPTPPLVDGAVPCGYSEQQGGVPPNVIPSYTTAFCSLPTPDQPTYQPFEPPGNTITYTAEGLNPAGQVLVTATPITISPYPSPILAVSPTGSSVNFTLTTAFSDPSQQFYPGSFGLGDLVVTEVNGSPSTCPAPYCSQGVEWNIPPNGEPLMFYGDSTDVAPGGDSTDVATFTLGSGLTEFTLGGSITDWPSAWAGQTLTFAALLFNGQWSNSVTLVWP
jgi:hypothetical protein